MIPQHVRLSRGHHCGPRDAFIGNRREKGSSCAHYEKEEIRGRERGRGKKEGGSGVKML